MKCSEFRAQHLEWLDAPLSAPLARAMRAHADACPACARYDTDLRAGLLLARHHRPLTVSRGFRERLQTRIALERFVALPSARPVTAPGITGRLTA